MPSYITGSASTFSSSLPIPVTGELVTAVSVAEPLRVLADRTAFLNENGKTPWGMLYVNTFRTFTISGTANTVFTGSYDGEVYGHDGQTASALGTITVPTDGHYRGHFHCIMSSSAAGDAIEARFLVNGSPRFCRSLIYANVVGQYSGGSMTEIMQITSGSVVSIGLLNPTLSPAPRRMNSISFTLERIGSI